MGLGVADHTSTSQGNWTASYPLPSVFDGDLLWIIFCVGARLRHQEITYEVCDTRFVDAAITILVSSRRHHYGWAEILTIGLSPGEYRLVSLCNAPDVVRRY